VISSLVTGLRIETDYGNISVLTDYEDVMKTISDELCQRSAELSLRVTGNSSELEEARNLTRKAEDALTKREFYSRASYCFGANIRMSNAILLAENASMSELFERIGVHEQKNAEFKADINNRLLKTINDLQAFEIVLERLLEAEGHLNRARNYAEKNETENAFYQFAYGVERYNSAISWGRFFGVPGRQLEINEASIKSSCIEKLSEAEERYQYVQLYMPLRLQNTREELDQAHSDMRAENYELCLFKATKAKAEADVVLSALSVGEEQLSNYVDLKLSIVENQIAKQQQNGHFPILGYSYYEYAKNLKKQDVYSALIYSEYALELSNIDIYFESKQKRFRFDMRLVSMFALGTIFGILVTLLTIIPKKR